MLFKSKTKSPLSGRPLNNPGDSLARMVLDKKLDEIMFPAMLFMMLVAMIAVTWLSYYGVSFSDPVMTTAVFGGVSIYLLVRIFINVRRIKRYELGLEGEIAVGQYLERMRKAGAYIFHDIEGDGFNLDHVVIHHSGVYVIETKTMSKPMRGECRLQFDGQEITRGGKPIKGDAIVQVKAACHWLRELLESSTGKKPLIKGVVTFPGWFIESRANHEQAAVWVLNPKAIPSFVTNRPPILAEQEVNLLSFHLSKAIRKTY